MLKITCPFCGNAGMQVGFFGTAVASIGCSLVSREASVSVKLASGDVEFSTQVMCPSCENTFTVSWVKGKEEGAARAVFPNLKVTNKSPNQTILITNNTMVEPYYSWQTTVGPGQSINYTKSPDFYMLFVEQVDPGIAVENLTNNLIYEVSVYRAALGTFKEKRALIPTGYHGDHDWSVMLGARDGLRVVAYSVKAFLLKHEAIAMEEYLSDTEIPDAESKVIQIIKRPGSQQ
jgi:hypothetical protein